jgi:hypothetical protein
MQAQSISGKDSGLFFVMGRGNFVFSIEIFSRFQCNQRVFAMKPISAFTLRHYQH